MSRLETLALIYVLALLAMCGGWLCQRRTRRDDYRDYQASTPMLFLWLPPRCCFPGRRGAVEHQPPAPRT